MQHGKSWEGVESVLGLRVRTSGALILQRKKGPECGRQRPPRRKNVYPVCPDPASALVQHRAEIRESQVGMLPGFFSVPVSLLRKAEGRKTSALKVRSWQPLERRRDPQKPLWRGLCPEQCSNIALNFRVTVQSGAQLRTQRWGMTWCAAPGFNLGDRLFSQSEVYLMVKGEDPFCMYCVASQSTAGRVP